MPQELRPAVRSSDLLDLCLLGRQRGLSTTKGERGKGGSADEKAPRITSRATRVGGPCRVCPWGSRERRECGVEWDGPLRAPHPDWQPRKAAGGQAWGTEGGPQWELAETSAGSSPAAGTFEQERLKSRGPTLRHGKGEWGSNSDGAGPGKGVYKLPPRSADQKKGGSEGIPIGQRHEEG